MVSIEVKEGGEARVRVLVQFTGEAPHLRWVRGSRVQKLVPNDSWLARWVEAA